MKLMTPSKILIVSFFCFSALIGCDSDDSALDISQVDSSLRSPDADTEEKIKKTKHIYYTIPTPMETSHLLKKAGATFNYRFLNDVQNLKKYESQKSKALNLGVYGADLSFISIFDQTQETMFYMQCVKKLADDLGITQAVDKTTIERMEANVENRDSMTALISSTYQEIDQYLKENDREYTAALVILGGWVEGLYLATSLLNESEYKNEGIKTRILDQRFAYRDLKSLLKLSLSEAELEEIMTYIQPIGELFDALSETKSPMVVQTDTIKKKTMLSGDNKVDVDEKFFRQIHEVTSHIRDKIITEQL
jgi:hypothetical protein